MKSKLKQNTPNLLPLRKSLFWDTYIKNIDWSKQYGAVIKSKFEKEEKKVKKDEIIRLHGAKKVNKKLWL